MILTLGRLHTKLCTKHGCSDFGHKFFLCPDFAGFSVIAEGFAGEALGMAGAVDGLVRKVA
jgi:hypothetical protein